MKKWFLLVGFVALLVACSDDKSELVIKRIENVSEDVQSVIDMTPDDKYASVIYSETTTSYLLLNTAQDTEVTIEPNGNDVHINIEQSSEDVEKDSHDVVYQFQLDQAYEKIHVYKNGQEIPFEVWFAE